LKKVLGVFLCSLTACAAMKSAPQGRAPARAEAAEGGAAADGREMIREGWVTLEVPHDQELRHARERVRNVGATLGGYVQAERTQGVTLAIPSSRLDEALTLLEKDGRILDRNITAQEVSRAHRDLQLRLENARTFRARLTELLPRTEDVQKLLEIEKELSKATEELELLQSQLQKMESDIAYARLDVALEKEVRPGPLGWLAWGIGMGFKWLFIWD